MPLPQWASKGSEVLAPNSSKFPQQTSRRLSDPLACGQFLVCKAKEKADPFLSSLLPPPLPHLSNLHPPPTPSPLSTHTHTRMRCRSGFLIAFPGCLSLCVPQTSLGIQLKGRLTPQASVNPGPYKGPKSTLQGREGVMSTPARTIR
jgi:hypothetical protein